MKPYMGINRTRGHAFSKERRILKKSDFVQLSQTNRKVYNQHFVALYHRNVTGITRLGITATKRVGNAVARNQIKRYIREFFRQQQHTIENGMDINIIVKTKASGVPAKEAYQSLKSIFRKIREKT